MEFNEFLKMKAFHKNNLTVRNSGELEEAFRLLKLLFYENQTLRRLTIRFFDRQGSGYISFSQLTEILFNMGYSPLQTENIDDIVHKCSKDGENVDYGKLARVLTDKNIGSRDDIK